MSKYNGVHSCGPNCQEPLCVANRRIAELTADRDLYKATCMADDALIKQLQAKVEEERCILEMYKASAERRIKELEDANKLAVQAAEYGIQLLQSKVEELTSAIQKWLDGDYPNPRRNRPHDCMHGVGYWQSCENCETEYWQSVLKQEGE
jgi:hypothetical protein